VYRQDDERPVLVAAFGGRVFGLEPRTGDVLWEQQFMVGGGTPELAIAGDRICVVYQQIFMMLEYPTGRVLAQTKLPVTYRGRATFIIEGERIFIGMGGEIVAVSRDGSVSWTQKFKGKGIGDIALGFPGNVRQADIVGQ
jgi:outer membrane protein assembly factor BamB